MAELDKYIVGQDKAKRAVPTAPAGSARVAPVTRWLERLPWSVVLIACASLGLAPVWSVAPNKLTAKVATRLVKPEGECSVAAGEEQAFLAPLGLELIPGIERDDLVRLREFNLRRAHEVAALCLEDLQVPFGSRAMWLYETVRGIDAAPVLAVGEKPPVITAEHTFAADTNDADTLRAALYRLMEQAGEGLRRRRQAARRVAVVLDYSDGVRCIRQAAVRPAAANDIILFEAARQALFLAETYQTPVFLLTDQFLADSYRAVEPFDVASLPQVEVGSSPAAVPLPYQRYALTDSGISPRLLPGLSQHLVVCDSDEHTSDGHITEDLDVRRQMVDKRLGKLARILFIADPDGIINEFVGLPK